MPPPPSNLVNFEDVTKASGTRLLLDRVRLGVARGERIGVVGRNGDGKSTLLGLLAGGVEPDSGRVTRQRDLRVGWLGQHDDLDPAATVRRIVVGDLAEHAWAADPATRTVVTQLLGAGSHGVDLDAAVGTLSGGERRRTNLARVLITRPDLLVLDEPTNHLDLAGIAWLAGHLRATQAGLVVVTHDRWFLDAVCTRTWEVAGGRVASYDGGYAEYVLTKAERGRLAAAAGNRRRNLLRKELAWLRRGSPARTSKPRFRTAAANALIAAEPPPRDQLSLQAMATSRLGKDVVDLEDVTVRFGDRRVLDGVTLRLGPADRIGLLGPNGAGKTTLVRVLTGAQPPAAGRVRRGSTVRVAMLGQTLSGLPAGTEQSVAGYVTGVHRSAGGGELSATVLLERFGFTGDRLSTRLGELSGGERRRLQLLQVLLDEPNLLILDEPTNDLDIETLTVLEDFLDSWPGTLVVVTHDRYFLERVTDQVYAMPGDGRVRHLPGGVEQYLSVLTGRAAGSPSASPAEPDSSRPSAAAEQRAARKRLARIENRIEKLADRQRRLHDQMAGHATDHLRLAELDAERRTIRAEHQRLEAEWYAALEQADQQHPGHHSDRPMQSG